MVASIEQTIKIRDQLADLNNVPEEYKQLDVAKIIC